MIKLPFTRATFASEMKPKMSGANLTLEYDNLESPLSKVAIEMGDLLSSALYGKICDKTAASGDDAETLNYPQTTFHCRRKRTSNISKSNR